MSQPDLTEAARESRLETDMTRAWTTLRGSHERISPPPPEFELGFRAGRAEIDKAIASFVEQIVNRSEKLGRGQFRSAFELVAEERGVEIQ